MAPLRRTAVLVLLLFPATATAQPSARVAVPIPVPAATLAAAVNSRNADRSRILLDAVRIMFDSPEAPGTVNGKRRAEVMALLRTPPSAPGDLVPLPLGTAVWRDTILETRVPDDRLIEAIFAGRETALLYFGLSALDDETLGWLAAHPDLLRHLKRHAGTFAAFGKSLRIRAGRVAIPGGESAAPLWQDVVGADPASPGEFARALFRPDRGRTAFFYDTVSHLDQPRQRAVLTRRLGALADVFHDFANDWDAEARPFARPQLDPSLLLLTMLVDENGTLAGPRHRGVWERVFRDDLNIDVAFRDVPPWKAATGDSAVDAAWLANRIHSVVAFPRGRRRLDTFLFGQRVFAAGDSQPHVTTSVLRAYLSMPSLMLTLERMGVGDAQTFLAAARHARAVNDIGDRTQRETAISLFQAAIGFIDGGTRSGGLGVPAAAALVDSLSAIPVDRGRGYDQRIAAWLQTELLKAAPQLPFASTDPVEEALLALLAGGSGPSGPVVEWEGDKYRVDPAAAEIARLRRVRERQGGPTVDAAIAGLSAGADGRESAQRQFRLAVVSVLYAAHLGDPDGPAVAAGNAALKHDLGLSSTRPGIEPMTAWKLPMEIFGGPLGWRVQGSLLALDAGLRRLALRRLDSGDLPSGPRMPVLERQTAMLTVALANPRTMTDETRDRLAAALARGRSRVEELRTRPALADDVANEAALSEWEREALKWSLTHAPEATTAAFSLLQLLWLGGGAADADAWGSAALPMTGCLCLAMPRPIAWENLTGRPASGLLATLGADVTLRVAEALAERRLPAALAPAVLSFAMQDVLDEAVPAYFDDWPAFSRAARAIGPDRIDDYIAALTADGPLVPAARRTF